MAAREMDTEILEILCCPQTLQPLRIANSDEITRANRQLSDPISEGLIREDGQVIYPVRNSIPLLVPEEGLPLTGTPPENPNPGQAN